MHVPAPTAIAGLLCLAVVSCRTTNPPAGLPHPVFDATGYDRFAALARALESGREPDEREWQMLLTAPGYDRILDTEHRAAAFRRLVGLAFRPADAAERDAVLAGGGAEGAILGHLLRYRDRHDDLAAWRGRLLDPATGAAWIAAALERTARFLPADLGPTGPAPRVQLVAYNPDGTANAESIVVDVLLTLELGEDRLRDFLAHELHHVFAARTASIPAPAASEPSYYLFHALRQLQWEGIADQIDKGAILDADAPPNGGFERRYFDAARRTDELLRAADAAIAEFGAVEAGRAAIAERIFALFPFAGHPTGAVMARTIRDAAGTPALVATIGDPFEFVRAHDRACRTLGREGWPLTAAATRVLEELERDLARRRGDGGQQ